MLQLSPKEARKSKVRLALRFFRRENEDILETHDCFICHPNGEKKIRDYPTGLSVAQTGFKHISHDLVAKIHACTIVAKCLGHA